MLNFPSFFNAQAGAYEIEQSLRFNSADSAYLNRTPGSAGNRKTWTFSCWLKLASLTQGERNILFGPAGVGGYGGVTIYQNNGLRFAHAWDPAGTDYIRQTAAVFRDPSAWYHVVYWCDTTQSGTRWKIYVNGVEQTLETPSGNNGEPSQNTDLPINSTNAHYLGGNPTYGYFSGYLAEVNFIDGSALDPEDFGEFDDNGVWRPKRYTGSYTGNSFYLKFDAADVDGDSSGLSNTWTANNFTTSGTGTDVMSDTPTTNYCTLNPLTSDLSYGTVANGNLDMSGTSSSGNITSSVTQVLTTGKYYWETTLTAGKTGAGSYPRFGFLRAADAGYPDNAGAGYTNSKFQYASQGIAYQSNGSKTIGGTETSYGNSYDNTDTIGIAYDGDNGAIYFSRNNIWQNSGDPTSGASKTGAALTWTDDRDYVFQSSHYNGTASSFNFGQRDFRYTPPTGYKALNTANLPAPDIADGSDYFQTVLDTGANILSSAQSAFSSGLWWIKDRANTNKHQLADSVAGTSSVYLCPTSGRATYSAPSGNSVAWCWGVPSSSTTDTSGSINTTVYANTDAGFSIASWSGTGVNATVGHGLNLAPDFVGITHSGDTVMQIGSSALSSWTNFLELNTTYHGGSSTNRFQGTAPTDTVVSVGTTNNVSGRTMYMYSWHSVPGYSKIGSYTGNGNADGTFVYTGFKPAWVMVKRTDSANDWDIRDTTRDSYNLSDAYLVANSNIAEGSANGIDILSNGFKIRQTSGAWNASGGTYIFMVFSENPFGGDGVSPATAR